MKKSYRAAAFLAFIGSLATPFTARAQSGDGGSERKVRTRPMTASLRWNVPSGAGCLDRGTLATATEERLGRRIFTAPAQADVRVEGRIAPRKPAGWVAHLELYGANGKQLGTRQLTTDSSECSALNDDLPLVIALMVDLPRKRIVLHVPKPAEEKQRVPEKPKDEPAETTRWGAYTSLRMLTAFGLLPKAAFGGEVAVAAWPDVLVPIELSAAFWPPTTERNNRSASSVWAWHVGLSVCPRPPTGDVLRIDLCVGAEAGQLDAEGVDFDVNRAHRGPLAQAVARFRIGVALGDHLELKAVLDGGVALVQHRFVFTAEGEEQQFYQASRIFGRAGLALGLRMPP